MTLTLLLALTACGEKIGETAPQTQATQTQWAKGAMVTAANPYAVDAGIEILKAGGSAVDAAIATHLVLGLVEPQSSGLGGGAFLLHFDHATRDMAFYDGRETAPAGAKIDMFMGEDGVLGFFEAVQSGHAIGTPGAVRLYEMVHARHGRLPWAALFQPALTLAREGFIVSPRLAGYLPFMAERTRLAINPGVKDYFFPGGEALEAGALLTNPEYAETLERLATEGADAFYKGTIAEAIVEAAALAPRPGTLTLEDLAQYEAVERPVICGPFRDLRICTTTPPSSGGAQIMIANLYEHLLPSEPSQMDRIQAFVDAQRLAYADRDHYFGDPDEVDIPLDALMNPNYLRARALERFAPDALPTPGDPSPFAANQDTVSHFGRDTTEEIAGTTHLSIIDQEGNAVSMTATVEGPFGSQRWAKGFVLNNEMTDFARAVPETGERLANAVAPNRRPRSSMSPTMVVNDANDLVLVTGSPGGNSIPAYVAKTLLGVLDWGMTAQEAADAPNIIARGEKVRVEVGEPGGQAIADGLNEKGYLVQAREGENSGLHLIHINESGLDGAADKRREGVVRQLP
ncbi:MAG: gamma-glutamyltransferase [Pseudomonadales bacterium]